MTDQELKVRENRVRRQLKRMGYSLVKSRTRDPRAYDYGQYIVTDFWTGCVVIGGSDGPMDFHLNLATVEAWINEDAEPNPPTK